MDSLAVGVLRLKVYRKAYPHRDPLGSQERYLHVAELWIRIAQIFDKTVDLRENLFGSGGVTSFRI
jgi:hypothetical protein